MKKDIKKIIKNIKQGSFLIIHEENLPNEIFASIFRLSKRFLFDPELRKEVIKFIFVFVLILVSSFLAIFTPGIGISLNRIIVLNSPPKTDL